MGFHRNMGNRRQRKIVFNHQIGFGESRIEIAFAAFVPAGNVRIFLGEEYTDIVFQIIDVVMH